MQHRKPSQIFILAAAAAAAGVLCVVYGLFFSPGNTNSDSDSAAPPGGVTESHSHIVEVRQDMSMSEGQGAISGAVLFAGKQLSVPPNGRGISDVVVYLKGSGLAQANADETEPLAGLPATDTNNPSKVVLDQFDMTFVPHVVMMHKGNTLEIRNSDTALHNVNGLATVNQAFNVAISPGSKTDVVLPRAEFIRVICNFHSRMSAWIAVLPNRFFARPDENGRFMLTNIPPGTYTLCGWHEDIYPPYAQHHTTMEVTVEPQHSTDVELSFP